MRKEVTPQCLLNLDIRQQVIRDTYQGLNPHMRQNTHQRLNQHLSQGINQDTHQGLNPHIRQRLLTQSTHQGLNLQTRQKLSKDTIQTLKQDIFQTPLKQHLDPTIDRKTRDILESLQQRPGGGLPIKSTATTARLQQLLRLSRSSRS